MAYPANSKKKLIEAGQTEYKNTPIIKDNSFPQKHLV